MDTLIAKGILLFCLRGERLIHNDERMMCVAYLQKSGVAHPRHWIDYRQKIRNVRRINFLGRRVSRYTTSVGRVTAQLPIKETVVPA